MQSASTDIVSKAELMTLDRLLGEFYLASALHFKHKLGKRLTSLDLVGSHGQTLFHQAGTKRKQGVTLQIGSAEAIAHGLGSPIVSDFRSADMAVGGRGAPLTPIAHHYLFAAPRCRQAIVNIGGISNATYLPGRKSIDYIQATDCGPGNMLIDQLSMKLFSKSYDKDGRIARSGSVDAGLLNYMKQMSFLKRKLPMALGREQFGNAAVDSLLRYAKSHRVESKSVISTAGYFTCYCIARNLRKYGELDRVLVCGGGSRNVFLMNLLSDMLNGVEVTSTACENVDPDFVESISFALLANLLVDGIPANLPQVTGASRRVLLGKITLV